MAYLLNSVDLETTYGIYAGQMPGGNIALQGCFDFPARVGQTLHEWGDEDGVEPWVEESEIFFGGRDINFVGHTFGTRTEIYSRLTSLYGQINSQASGTVVFSTPYGDYNVYVKNADVRQYDAGGCTINIEMREPVVTVTGGSLPAADDSDYQIDGIPMVSFGLYLGSRKDVFGLPEMKGQYFTKIEAEGYQIAKRLPVSYYFDGVITGTSIVNFNANIKNLFELFRSSGLRTFNIMNELTIVGFLTEGFKVTDVIFQNGMTGRLRANFIVTSIT